MNYRTLFLKIMESFVITYILAIRPIIINERPLAYSVVIKLRVSGMNFVVMEGERINFD